MLLSIYQISQVNYLFCKKETCSKIKQSLFGRLNMIKKGFHGESKIIYQLSGESYKHYLSDYKRLKTKFINGKYSFILNNKVVFEHTFRDYVKTPKSFALIEKGKIVPLGNYITDFDSLIEYINKNNYIVLKPISGGGGAGVIILKKIKEEIYANNKKITINELEKTLNKLDQYFLSEYIHQGDFATSFNQDTLNSMRIVTMVDPYSYEAFIPIAVQRIGTFKSSPADNWTQGGISAEIDINTGIIGKGATYPVDGKVIWHEKHPDNSSEIAGVKIPEWESVKNCILNVANKFPYIKYIGWDVVLTNDGIMVIEGNNCSDVNLLQIHRPLLNDEKVKAFYQYHGII